MPSHILPALDMQHIQQVDQSNKKWWKRFWVCLCVVITLILVGSITAIISIYTTATCSTSACNLISAMDTSVDPCQDFFQYACGGWIKNNPIPAGAASWGVSQKNFNQQDDSSILNVLKAANNPSDPIPVNQARDFYAACMNTTQQESLGLEPLLNFLNSLGGWPMTLESWNDDNLFSWQKTVATITRLYKTGILLEVFNLSDMKNTSQNIIYISEASFVLKRAELLNPNSEKNKIAAYTTFITDSPRLRNRLEME